MELPKVGETWKCIKTVEMIPSGDIAYVSGTSYKCESPGCLKNEMGDKEHSVSDLRFLTEHFQRIAKFEDFPIGAILKSTLSGDSWLLRKGVRSYLRLKKSDYKQDWVLGDLGKSGNFELACSEEKAWFEYCEKNQAFTSLEDFRILSCKKGDKVRMIRTPSREEWLEINEPMTNVSNMLGKVYTVFHCDSHLWLSLQNVDRFFPTKCFELVLDNIQVEVPKEILFPDSYLSGFAPGDKVEYYRTPIGEDWIGIGEVHIPFTLGQTLIVKNSFKKEKSITFESYSCVYPMDCFRPLIEKGYYTYSERIKPETPDPLLSHYRMGIDPHIMEPNLYKKKTTITFDTEVERVKDLSDIKLFKPSKNRYT